MSNSNENGGSSTESEDGEIIFSPTADAVGESPDEMLELVGVIPSYDEMSMEEVQLEEEREESELATFSPGETGSSVLGFWHVWYL